MFVGKVDDKQNKIIKKLQIQIIKRKKIYDKNSYL